MALIIYFLMLWGIISSPAEATNEVILDNQESLEIIIGDDLDVT